MKYSSEENVKHIFNRWHVLDRNNRPYGRKRVGVFIQPPTHTDDQLGKPRT